MTAALLVSACGTKKLDVPDEKPTGPPPICAVESPELCLQDGVDLYHGLNRETDLEGAQKKFELACAGGEQRGCTYLGMMLTASDDGMDVRRGLGLLDEACEAEVVMACAEMGAQLMGRAWMQSEADGEPATAAFNEANRRLRRACEMVETPAEREFWGRTPKGYACSNLGSAFEHGFGVKKDLELAFDLHRQACGLGFQGGCAQVAYFVDNGLVGDADAERAAAIYQTACDNGDHMACTNLAQMLVDGDGIGVDIERAKRILVQPCGHEYPGACDLLHNIETIDE